MDLNLIVYFLLLYMYIFCLRESNLLYSIVVNFDLVPDHNSINDRDKICNNGGCFRIVKPCSDEIFMIYYAS